MTLLQKIQKLTWWNEIAKLKEILRELKANTDAVAADVSAISAPTGVSGTFANPASITVVDGIVTAVTAGV